MKIRTLLVALAGATLMASPALAQHGNGGGRGNGGMGAGMSAGLGLGTELGLAAHPRRELERVTVHPHDDLRFRHLTPS